MTPTEAIDFGRDGITVLLTVVTPIMAVGLTVGITIALFQSLTQIQEITLVFVPKILAVFISLMLLLPFILSTLTAFMDRVALRIIGT
jgi:flagellar biosynthetic protein FliQ